MFQEHRFFLFTQVRAFQNLKKPTYVRFNRHLWKKHLLLSDNLRDQLDGYSVKFEKFVALNPFKRRDLLRDIWPLCEKGAELETEMGMISKE